MYPSSWRWNQKPEAIKPPPKSPEKHKTKCVPLASPHGGGARGDGRAIENAYKAELRVDADVSATIDTPIRILDSAPGPVARGHKTQVWLDAQSAGW